MFWLLFLALFQSGLFWLNLVDEQSALYHPRSQHLSSTHFAFQLQSPQNSAGPWRLELFQEPALGRQSACVRTRLAQHSPLPHRPESFRLCRPHLGPGNSIVLDNMEGKLGLQQLGLSPEAVPHLQRDSQGQSVTHRFCLFQRISGGVWFFYVPWLPNSEFWLPISEMKILMTYGSCLPPAVSRETLDPLKSEKTPAVVMWDHHANNLTHGHERIEGKERSPQL